MESDERNHIIGLEKRVEAEPIGECPTLRIKRVLENPNLDWSDEEIWNQLREIIQNNLVGCDLIIGFLSAATRSFRADQFIRPFPKWFIKANNEKDMDALRQACEKIPRLPDLISYPMESIPKDVVELLKWLFLTSGIPSLKIHTNKLPISIVSKQARMDAVPQYIFKVEHSIPFEEFWKIKTGDRETFYAFHGSSVTNFFSIVKFGLQDHFGKNKEVLYGKGIYLSDDISVCTNYSQFGETWKNSNLGQRHSIIAVCEVINDENEVKCKDEKNKTRAINANSYGKIPEKYFVVTNNELVKIRYLLVYGKQRRAVPSFLKKHFIWIILTSYILMIIFVGFFNGPHWPRLLRYLSNLFQ